MAAIGSRLFSEIEHPPIPRMHPRPERLALLADEQLDRRAPFEPIHLRRAQAVNAGLVERNRDDAPHSGVVEDGLLAPLDHADQVAALL